MVGFLEGRFVTSFDIGWGGETRLKTSGTWGGEANEAVEQCSYACVLFSALLSCLSLSSIVGQDNCTHSPVLLHSHTLPAGIGSLSAVALLLLTYPCSVILNYVYTCCCLEPDAPFFG